MNNGYCIIDAHCHIYPAKIAARAAAGIGTFYRTKSACGGTAEELLRRADACGIDRFIVESVATSAHQVRDINEFIAAEVAAAGGRFFGLGTLYPDSPDLVGDYRHLRELGLHGIKLHPDIQGFKIDEGRRQIYLPSIGWVKYKRSRFIQGKAKNVTVSRQADGWHVSIQTEYEMEPPKHAGDSVGIDMGCVRFCTLSDGTFFEPCGALKKALKKLARMQRRLARMQKFGKNWRKQKAAIARLHQHIANVRRDFIEKVSLNICKNHAEIFREDLKIKNMTASAKGTVEEPGSRVAQKSGLNRSILDQGWRIFFSKLDWKALRLGGHVHTVPPQNTSRTCPICGCVSKDNRKTQALFKCVSCGHQGNADVVAAINIKERGRSSLACGESERNAQAQVNLGRSKKPAPNQQQESTEVISSASC